MVDPKAGTIRTLRGLDFERQRNYQLVIGTEEAMLAETIDAEESTCTVEITVVDRNDIPPVFTRTPRGNVIDVRPEQRFFMVLCYRNNLIVDQQ